MESQAAQGPTSSYCPASEFAPEDPYYRPHLMTAHMGGGVLVKSVEICNPCGWINFAALDGYAEAAIKESMDRRAQRIAVAAQTEPFSFVQMPGDELTFEEVVFQALGAASMCWVGGTGSLEFDSTRAKSIGVRLMDELRMHARQERKDAIRSACLQFLAAIDNVSGTANPLIDLRKLARAAYQENA